MDSWNYNMEIVQGIYIGLAIVIFLCAIAAVFAKTHNKNDYKQYTKKTHKMGSEAQTFESAETAPICNRDADTC